MSKRIVFLSPHYDDAIYSCGGVIAEWQAAGQSITVLTIMAGEPTLPVPDTPVLQDNHTRWQVGESPMMTRRKEDQTAAEILGIATVYDDILDCIYRTHNNIALYPSEVSLWDVIHTYDDTLQRLKQTPLPPADVYYAPFGVGGHVDHLIIRDWGLQLAKQGKPVEFYLEYPYIRDEDAIHSAHEVFPEDVKMMTRSFSESAMQRKIEAMAAYETQISSFWDSPTAITKEVQQTFRSDAQDDTFVERFAQLTKMPSA